MTSSARSAELDANRTTWEQWTEINYQSAFYDVDAFLQGGVPRRQRLDALDAELLGDVNERSLLHLQCHFGMDTLTQARRGARVVGVDFSPRAIAKADELAKATQLSERSEFVEADVLQLDLRNESGNLRQFDLVYTSHGVLGWLSDLTQWAQVVRRHLKSGGRFVLIEGHPFALMSDDSATRPTEELIERQNECWRRLAYPYFPGQPMRLESNQVYSDAAAEVASVTYEWSHSLSEIFNALIAAGLQIERFEEYAFCAWQMTPDMVEDETGVWVQPAGQVQLPLTFAICARG